MDVKQTILKWVDPLIRLPVVGLDISDRTAKYLKLRSNGKIFFDAYGEIDIPAGLISDGEIKQEGELAKVFRSWLAKEKRHLRSTLVVASLPEEKSFLRLIQLPKVKREEVGSAIRWEIEANIPLPLEELIFDYEVIEPLENSLDHFDVVVTAFPRMIIESYVRVLKQAGLQPVALELESQAIIRSVVENLRERPARIVVDMGRNRTSFVIFSGGAIIFTTTIALGGQVLEEHISKTLGVSAEKAITLKKDVGLDKRREEGKMFPVLLPALAVLADELRKALEYYQNHTKHTHGASLSIHEVLLTGGDANLWGLDTYLASALKVPVRLADPWAVLKPRLGYEVPPIPKNQALAFVTAVGLAMRGLR